MVRGSGKITIVSSKSSSRARSGAWKVARDTKTGKFVAAHSTFSVAERVLSSNTSSVNSSKQQPSYFSPDLAFANLPVVPPLEAHGGDPRDMSDDDLKFFGLER